MAIFLIKRLNLPTKTITCLKRITTFTMSWQAKQLVLALLLFPFLFACEDPSNIGDSLLENELGILYTDTITVKASTVQLDTVRTARLGSLLVGRYIDPVFGVVEASSFFQLVPYNNKFTIASGIVYDSLTFVMVYNYAYADTTKSQTINICRLKEMIDTTGKRELVNNTVINYDPVPLAKITMPLRPRYKDGKTFDTIRVKLPNSLGVELFKLADKTETSTYRNFVEYFKGLALVPGNNDNASVVGFSTAYANNILTATRMDIHYHQTDKTTADYFPFSLDDVGQFVRIVGDRKGTPIASVSKPLVAVPSSATQNNVYLQNGAGLVAKLEFPYLSKFRAAGKFGINKVEMVLTPQSYTSLRNVLPLGAIYLGETDKNNKVLKDSTGLIKYVTTEGFPLVGTNPATDRQVVQFSPSKGEYIFNLTSYVAGMLQGTKANNGLLIAPVINNNINRMILDAKQIKLKVYYTVPKN
jgi:hypothetical protein